MAGLVLKKHNSTSATRVTLELCFFGLNPSNAGPEYVQDPNLVSSVPADALAPSNAGWSVAQYWLRKLYKFPSKVSSGYQLLYEHFCFI